MNTTTAPPVYRLQPAAQPFVTVAPAPSAISPGGMISTVLLASSIAIGANMVAVQRGSMSSGMAVLNGVAKGTVASLTLAVTNRVSTASVIATAGTLAVAGFVIDYLMTDSIEKDASSKKGVTFKG